MTVRRVVILIFSFIMVIYATGCSAGSYLLDDSTTCETCPKGHMCYGNNKIACPVGMYQSAEGSNTCDTCTGQRYSSEEASTSCSYCNGTASSDGSSTGNNICDNASSNDTDEEEDNSSTETIACEAGYYPNDESTACNPCNPGHYCPDGYQQIECSAGKVAAGTEATKCTECGTDTIPNDDRTSCVQDPTTMGVLDLIMNGDVATIAVVVGIVLLIIIIIICRIQMKKKNQKKEAVVSELEQSTLYKRSYKTRQNAAVDHIQRYVKKIEDEAGIEANRYGSGRSGGSFGSPSQVGFENYHVEQGQLVSMLGDKLSKRVEFEGSASGANPAMTAAPLGMSAASPAAQKTYRTEGAITTDFAAMRGRASDKLTHVVKYGRRAMGGSSTLGKPTAYHNRRGMSVSMYNKY